MGNDQPEGRGWTATALFPAVPGRVRGYFRRPLILFCPAQSGLLPSPRGERAAPTSWATRVAYTSRRSLSGCMRHWLPPNLVSCQPPHVPLKIEPPTRPSPSPGSFPSPRCTGVLCMSEFAPSSHPMVPETLRTVKAGSPAGALGQKVRVVEAIVMVKLGHARIICLQGRLTRDRKRHDAQDVARLPVRPRC